jgi:hypothetical protein
VAKKTETSPLPPFKPIRVQKVVLSFLTGTYDEEGHLRDEGMAPHQIPLMFPFDINSTLIQQAVQEIETRLNTTG